MPTTTGMKAGGFYDAHSGAQRAALDVFLPWLEEVISENLLPVERRPIGLLDLGSSEGANAIHAMGRLVEALRRKTSEPIWVFFDDLPTNDFNRLFANLYPKGDPALPGADVYAAAVGGSAFGRVVPDASLQLATSYNAIGFLETLPSSPLPNYVLPMAPGASRNGVGVTPAEHEPFRRQAAMDMRRFYEARAAELASGGRLLVQVFGRDGDVSTSHGIYDVLSDALLDLVDEGSLSQDFYRDLVFPVYFRSLDELIEPIACDTALAGAFQIERAEAKEVAVPFNTRLTADGDLAAWAESYTGFLRAFTEPVLVPRLKDAPGAAQIVDAVYLRVQEHLRAEPARYDFRYIALGVLLSRR
jgi:hypothetical protein